MKEIKNYNEIDETGGFEEFKFIQVGAYPIMITGAEDISDKQYLVLNFEISGGEYLGYYGILKNKFDGDYRGKFIRSYKEGALPFFKGTMSAIEKSNPNYKWDWNEKSLIGKKAIMVYREEEYVNNKNEIKVAVKPFRIASTDETDIKIPKRKEISDDAYDKVNDRTSNITDDNAPF